MKKLNAAVLRPGGGSSSGAEGVVTAGGGSGQQHDCHDCAMVLYSAAQLKRHMQFAHGREEQLCCQVSIGKWRGSLGGEFYLLLSLSPLKRSNKIELSCYKHVPPDCSADNWIPVLLQTYFD